MTSKERVHIPPSFGIETFYVAQKFMLWYLVTTHDRLCHMSHLSRLRDTF